MGRSKLMRRVQRAFSPWPESIAGVGEKTMGPLARCVRCRSRTFVRYGGGTVLCLRHALEAAAPGAGEAAPAEPRPARAAVP